MAADNKKHSILITSLHVSVYALLVTEQQINATQARFAVAMRDCGPLYALCIVVCAQLSSSPILLGGASWAPSSAGCRLRPLGHEVGSVSVERLYAAVDVTGARCKHLRTAWSQLLLAVLAC